MYTHMYIQLCMDRSSHLCQGQKKLPVGRHNDSSYMNVLKSIWTI